MPRENRKRGKKHKKTVEDQPASQTQHYEEQHAEPEAGPSWIVPGPNDTQINEEAPFGYVDAEVKAYFRTVDVQLREWQEEGHAFAESEDADPNEDRRLFFVAALTEMSEKEKELATDPDCSNILERMAHSMDDFARRVFMDRLTGSYEKLMKHRFASHVCQTFLEVANDTISRECRGIIPSTPESSEEGELPLMKSMVLDLCEELLPNFSSLLMDPFASHPLRALLALLTPDLFTPEQRASILRSKKSAGHKARQGLMKSVFVADKQQTTVESVKATPPEFASIAVKFVQAVRDNLGGNEVRALAASSVASPVLQMLLDIEAADGSAYETESLADRVLDGLISKLLENGDEDDATYEPSDYVGTLLRDPTSSHLLETLVRRLPENVFGAIWRTYFAGKLARLAAHPVANFVVAKTLERVSATQLEQTCEELSGASTKIYQTARTGVLRAVVDRAAVLKEHEEAAVQLVLSGAELTLDSDEDRQLVVPCLLRLLTAEAYKKARESKPRVPTEDQHSGPRARGGYQKDRTEDPLAPKTQGAVLLQSMLHLSTPHNQVVIASVFAQSIEDQIAMGQDATSSRVFDVLLQSPTVPHKEKRKFVMNFIGHYHLLVDDRIGSRVGDNCWAFADTYLKEKIARSVIPHEHTLIASFYGKFFARHLNLHLLQRNPEQWKTAQINSKAQAQPPAAPAPQPKADPTAETPKEKSKKRKAQPEDEIEQLFQEKLGKKVKKAVLEASGGADAVEAKEERSETKERKRRKDGDREKDRGLTDVLSAIKAAPKDDKTRRSKKKKTT